MPFPSNDRPASVPRLPPVDAERQRLADDLAALIVRYIRRSGLDGVGPTEPTPSGSQTSRRPSPPEAADGG